LAGPKGGWVNAKVITVESGKSGTGCLTVPSNHGFVVGPMGVSRTTIGGEHVFSVSQSISPAGAAAPMARSILRPPQPALQSFKLLDQVRERF